MRGARRDHLQGVITYNATESGSEVPVALGSKLLMCSQCARIQLASKVAWAVHGHVNGPFTGATVGYFDPWGVMWLAICTECEAP